MPFQATILFLKGFYAGKGNIFLLKGAKKVTWLIDFSFFSIKLRNTQIVVNIHSDFKVVSSQ